MINASRTGALTLDSSNDQALELKGYFKSVAAQFPSSTSLQVKYYLSYDGGTNYEPVYSWDATGANTPANSADVIAAGDCVFFPCPGATHVKVARTAGSGTVVISASEADAPAAILA